MNVSLRKAGQGKKIGVFSPRYSKNCILNENLTHRCAQTGHLFSKSGHFFAAFKKGLVRPLPLPPASCTPANCDQYYIFSKKTWNRRWIRRNKDSEETNIL